MASSAKFRKTCHFKWLHITLIIPSPGTPWGPSTQLPVILSTAHTWRHMCIAFWPIYHSDVSVFLAQSWTKPALPTMHLYPCCAFEWPTGTSKHRCTVLSLLAHVAEGVLAVLGKTSGWPDGRVVVDNPRMLFRALRIFVVCLWHAATPVWLLLSNQWGLSCLSLPGI